MSMWSVTDWGMFFTTVLGFITTLYLTVVKPLIASLRENTAVTIENTADRAVKTAETVKALDSLADVVTTTNQTLR